MKELGNMSSRSLLNVVFPLEEAPLTPMIIAFLDGSAIGWVVRPRRIATLLW
jgi:hypothetical protein